MLNCNIIHTPKILRKFENGATCKQFIGFACNCISNCAAGKQFIDTARNEIFIYRRIREMLRINDLDLSTENVSQIRELKRILIKSSVYFLSNDIFKFSPFNVNYSLNGHYGKADRIFANVFPIYILIRRFAKGR